MLDTKRYTLSRNTLAAIIQLWGKAGKYRVVTISGHSMFPLIRDGDKVLLDHGYAGIQRGDVIAFREGARLVTHRVLTVCVRSTKPTFVTKGDNSLRFDRPFGAEQIVGRVVAVERHGRYMPLDTSTWRILAWLLAVGMLVWAKVHRRGGNLKERFLGVQPNHFTAFLSSSTMLLLSLGLKFVQALFAHCYGGSQSLSKQGAIKQELGGPSPQAENSQIQGAADPQPACCNSNIER